MGRSPSPKPPGAQANRRETPAAWLLLLAVFLSLVLPLWRQGSPRTPGWERVLADWHVGARSRGPGLHVWTPHLEGGLALSRHPRAGFVGFWPKLFALPGPSALRLFLSLLILVSLVSTYELLRGMEGARPFLRALGACWLLSSPWWMDRLRGGEIELAPALWLPPVLLLLSKMDRPSSRLRLLGAALSIALATAHGEPILLVLLLAVGAACLLRSREAETSLLPRGRPLAIALILGGLFALPRLVGLVEGRRWLSVQQGEAERSSWGELVRRHGLTRDTWTSWRHPARSDGAKPGRSGRERTPMSLPRCAIRIPSLALVLAGLRGSAPFGAAEWAGGLLFLGTEVPSVLPLRSLGFFAELLLMLAALRGAIRIARTRPGTVWLLGGMVLLLQLHGWEPHRGPFSGLRRHLLLPPETTALTHVVLSDEGTREQAPLGMSSLLARDLGVLDADPWAPFPNPVEARWILRPDRLERNPYERDDVLRLDDAVRKAELLDAGSEGLILLVRSRPNGRVRLNLLHAPGLRSAEAVVEEKGGLLELSFPRGHDGLVRIRYGPTPLETGAVITSVIALCLAGAWALGTVSGPLHPQKG